MCTAVDYIVFNTCTKMSICCICSSITSSNSHQNFPPQHPTLTYLHTRPRSTLYQPSLSKAIPYPQLPPPLPDGNDVGEEYVANKVDKPATFLPLHRPQKCEYNTTPHTMPHTTEDKNMNSVYYSLVHLTHVPPCDAALYGGQCLKVIKDYALYISI